MTTNGLRWSFNIRGQTCRRKRKKWHRLRKSRHFKSSRHSRDGKVQKRLEQPFFHFFYFHSLTTPPNTNTILLLHPIIPTKQQQHPWTPKLRNMTDSSGTLTHTVLAHSYPTHITNVRVRTKALTADEDKLTWESPFNRR